MSFFQPSYLVLNFYFQSSIFRRPPANILCAPLITIIRLAAFSLTARCHYCHAVVVRFTSCHPLNATNGCGEWRQNKQAVRARPPQYAPAPVTLTFDLKNGVRVMCHVGYLCANFSLPRPLCSRLRPEPPDVRDRHQTASSLNAPPRGAGT